MREQEKKKDSGASTSGGFGSSLVGKEPPNPRSAGGANAFRPVPRRPARRSSQFLWGVGLLWLALAAGWYGTRPRGPDLRRVANLAAPGEVVVFFGDSITQGYGVRPEESFPALVARDLGLAGFVNAGVPGDTTAAGFARIERDVLPHRPRLTLVELGGNDFLRRVPVEETLKNLEAIVDSLVAQGMMVVILHVEVGLTGDPYLQGYRAVADRHGAVLVEGILRGILSDPRLRLDPIHPNGRGHRVIADRVVKVLAPLLQEADRRRGSPGRASQDSPLPDSLGVGTLRAS